MANEGPLNLSERLQIIDEINSQENKDRKSVSQRQTNIYEDNLQQYVYEELKKQLNDSTIQKMPVVYSINLAKRIVDQKASLYNEAPKREFTNLSDDQEEKVRLIYRDMMANTVFKRANKLFKLQQQNLLKLVPKNGKLTMKTLKSHYYDVIPEDYDPEDAKAYILNVFDRYFFENSNESLGYSNQKPESTQYSVDRNTMSNSEIADNEDYRALLDKYVVWQKHANFVMDNKGNIITDTETPLPKELPFVDIAADKDFNYFVKVGNLLVDFCIQFNAALSDANYIVRMQGYSQPVYKGPKGSRPGEIIIGVDKVMCLETDPDFPDNSDFKFVSPAADLSGVKEHYEGLLTYFLTSLGLSPDVVSGTPQAQSFGSGIERLLAMIDKFEATREDIDLFELAEKRTYDLVRAWHNRALEVDGLLDAKYLSSRIPDDSELVISYRKPELVQTLKEKMEEVALAMEFDSASRLDMIKVFHNIDNDEDAEKKAAEIDALKPQLPEMPMQEMDSEE